MAYPIFIKVMIMIIVTKFKEFIKFIKRPICKHRGHNWDTYTVSTGYWGNDIEQAGYCKRCGEDTHGEYVN